MSINNTPYINLRNWMDGEAIQQLDLNNNFKAIDAEFGKRGFNVHWTGANGDGTKNDLKKINMAEEAVLNNGESGTLYFPKGNYFISSTWYPKSGLRYVFDKDAKIVYRVAGTAIILDNVTGIEFYGLTINHEAKSIDPSVSSGEALKIQNGSNDIRFYNTIIDETPTWSIYIQDSYDIWFDGYERKLLSHVNWNKDDGICLTGCHDVNLINCRINSNDDCIAIKSNKGKTYNINIIGGTLSSKYGAAIKIGNELSNDVENINIDNVTILNSRANIKLEDITSEEGKSKISNISFSNIKGRDFIGNTSWFVFANILRKNDWSGINFSNLNFTGAVEWDAIRVENAQDFHFLNCNITAINIESPKINTRNRGGFFLNKSERCSIEQGKIQGYVNNIWISNNSYHNKIKGIDASVVNGLNYPCKFDSTTPENRPMYNTIEQCNFKNDTLSGINFIGYPKLIDQIIRYNQGIVTEARGIVTIPAGSKSVDVITNLTDLYSFTEISQFIYTSGSAVTLLTPVRLTVNSFRIRVLESVNSATEIYWTAKTHYN